MAPAPPPPLPVTEDTPPDMLAGSMDLHVTLPAGRTVKMSAERCTPMMDLLVQITTANKMAPGGFVLQPVGERGVLPYKPSTPIGALDTWTIQIVPKARTNSISGLKKAPLKPNNQQPFEQTFRLQVHLPRNQLFVTRVSPKSLLSDVLNLACSEKNLDPNKYELRHPANLEERLRPELTLADYRLQEVTLVAKGNRPLGSGLSSSDIMALQKEEEKRRQQVKANGGSAVLGLMLGKNNQSSGCDGSISSDSLGGRSISPTRSDETPSPPGSSLPPPRPMRKRRPAPKPPTEAPRPQQPPAAVISHSRNSSDSSGYHEASILSESPESNGLSSPSGTLPRRSKLTNNTAQPTNGTASHNLSRSLSNLAHASNGEHKPVPLNSFLHKNGHSVSTTSLSSYGHGKKKKVAPPPPPVASAAPAVVKSTLHGQLLPEQRTASLSTLSSQSSGDSFDRELYSKSGTLERPSSSQSSTTSNTARQESLPEEICVEEEEEEYLSPSPQRDLIQNVSNEITQEIQEEYKRTNVKKKYDEALLQTTETEMPKTHHPLLQNISLPHDPQLYPPQYLVEEEPIPLKPKTQMRSKSPNIQANVSAFTYETATPVSNEVHNDAASNTTTTKVVASPRASVPDVVTELEKEDDDIQQEFENVTKELEAVILAEEANQAAPESISPNPIIESPSTSLVDWEYHLPAPPSAFRDSQSPTLTRETDNSSDITATVEATPEVLPPVEFIDNDKLLQENETNSLTSLIIEKECPLIQNLVKGVTKVNPLFNEEKYEAEFLEDAKTHDKEKPIMSINEREVENEEDWSPQLLTEDPIPNEGLKDKNKLFHQSSSPSPHENHQVNPLKNFTISTYQSSREVDLLFTGENVSPKQTEFKKNVETSIYKRKDLNYSTGSNLPRNNSFSTKNNFQYEHGPVKRSTSHVSLKNSGRTFRAKSIGNLSIETSGEGCGLKSTESTMLERHEGLRKTTSEANINQDFGRSSRLAELQDQFLQWQEQLLRQTQPDIPPQSLQVLRNILSPSQEGFREKSTEKSVVIIRDNVSAKTRNTDNSEPFEDAAASRLETQHQKQPNSADNSNKQYSYQGPPAVNFSTWSERPKSHVSIKVDNDYRIGKGQNSSGSNRIENEMVIREKKIPEDQVDSKANNVVLSRSESISHMNVRAKVEPNALTMRIISHSTPSGYKKTSSISPDSSNISIKFQDLSQNKEKETSTSHPVVTRGHSYNTAQMTDPSRVPIVRAVELKKTFSHGQHNTTLPEKKQSTSSVKLSWDEESNPVKSALSNGNKSSSSSSSSKYNNTNDYTNAEETFQGVNNLAKRFSLAATNSEYINNIRPKNRPVSAYLNNESIIADTKKVVPNVSKAKELNSVSNGLHSVKKYTSVVGVNGVHPAGNNKEPLQDVIRPAPKVISVSTAQKGISNSVPKLPGMLNARHPMPVVKGFRFATNDYSDTSLVSSDSYKVPQNSQQSVMVKVQQSNSVHNSNQRNSVVIEPPSIINVRTQPALVSTHSTVLPNGNQQIPVPPSAPVLPKKIQPSIPKSFPASEVNPRDQLMDAIRNFGGRGKLRQVRAQSPNNILLIV